MIGPMGPVGPAGPAGAAGAPGATGPAGPGLPTGGTAGQIPSKIDSTNYNTQWVTPVWPLRLYDSSNQLIGRIVSMGYTGYSVITSTGHQVEIQYNATFKGAQIFYSASCSGASGATAYLNDGAPAAGTPAYGKLAVWSTSKNSFMVPSSVTNNASLSVSASIGSVDNPTCSDYTDTVTGWALKTATRTDIGLPATITAPLTVQ